MTGLIPAHSLSQQLLRAMDGPHRHWQDGDRYCPDSGYHPGYQLSPHLLGRQRLRPERHLWRKQHGQGLRERHPEADREELDSPGQPHASLEKVHAYHHGGLQPHQDLIYQRGSAHRRFERAGRGATKLTPSRGPTGDRPQGRQSGHNHAQHDPAISAAATCPGGLGWTGWTGRTGGRPDRRRRGSGRSAGRRTSWHRRPAPAPQ